MKLFKVFSIVLMIAVSYTVSAQGIRHVKGIKGVELGYGVSKLTTQFQGSYISHLSPAIYSKVTGSYLKGEEDGYKFTSMGVDIAPVWTPFPFSEIVYFNVTGGLNATYTQFSPAVSIFDDSGNVTKDAFGTVKFGVFAGIEVETFISDKFVLVLGANQRLLFGDQFGKNRYVAFGALRYNF